MTKLHLNIGVYFAGDELKKRVDGFEAVKKNFDQARKTYIAKR
jgi:hypothetical protein